MSQQPVPSIIMLRSLYTRCAVSTTTQKQASIYSSRQTAYVARCEEFEPRSFTLRTDTRLKEEKPQKQRALMYAFYTTRLCKHTLQ